MKKSIIFAIILVIALTPLMSVSSSAEYYNMNLDDMRSEAYLLINLDTDTVVFSQNADERLKCASLVKTATAVVVFENCDDLDAVVTVTESALEPLKGLYSASCDLQVGEKISVRNLMYCMMLENANDAANVLAEYVAGSVDDFVVMMNDLAKSIGCKNTNFTNPTGLDEEGEYSSAYDMYLITKYALNYSVIADMANTVNYTVPATNLSEERELNTFCDIIESGTRYYYEYASGFKSGQTDEAERCASVVATKDAYSYIGIVLGCPNECIDGCGYADNTALYEARRMLRWAFRELSMTTVAEPYDIIAEVPVSLSAESDHIRLVPEKQVQALLLSSVDKTSLEFVYETQEDVMAPVEKGDVLGKLDIKYADNVIASVNLVAGDSVSRSSILYIGHIIKTVVLSPIFLIIAAVILVAVIIYMMILYARHKQKQRDARKRLREIKESNYASIEDLTENDGRKTSKKR